MCLVYMTMPSAEVFCVWWRMGVSVQGCDLDSTYKNMLEITDNLNHGIKIRLSFLKDSDDSAFLTMLLMYLSQTAHHLTFCLEIH